MMLEIPSRRDALPPAGVGRGARDKSLTCRIPVLSRLCVFYLLMKMGVFTFVCEIDTFIGYGLDVCVCREVPTTHLPVVMSHIEVLQQT